MILKINMKTEIKKKGWYFRATSTCGWSVLYKYNVCKVRMKLGTEWPVHLYSNKLVLKRSIIDLLCDGQIHVTFNVYHRMKFNILVTVYFDIEILIKILKF